MSKTQQTAAEPVEIVGVFSIIFFKIRDCYAMAAIVTRTQFPHNDRNSQISINHLINEK